MSYIMHFEVKVAGMPEDKWMDFPRACGTRVSWNWLAIMRENGFEIEYGKRVRAIEAMKHIAFCRWKIAEKLLFLTENAVQDAKDAIEALDEMLEDFREIQSDDIALANAIWLRAE